MTISASSGLIFRGDMIIIITILLSDVKCTEAMVKVLVPQISMIINGIFY